MGQFSVEICTQVGQFSMKLNNEGFDVVQAENGAEVISLLDQVDGFDVLFTDLQVPGKLDVSMLPYTPGTGTPRCRCWSSPALTQTRDEPP